MRAKLGLLCQGKRVFGFTIRSSIQFVDARPANSHVGYFNYRGQFNSLTDYAEELIEGCYGGLLKNLPESIRYHFDYEGIAHDMELSGP